MAKKFFDDPDLPEEELPENVAPFPLPLRILGYTIKYAFWAFVVTVIGLLFWRMFSTGIPKDMKTLWADAQLREAYAAYLADTNEEKAPFAIQQAYFMERNITVAAEDEETGQKDNYGYFAMVDQAIFPTAGQVQVIFRYNFSTLEHLNQDYNLGFSPDKDEDWYVVKVRAMVYNNTDTKNVEDVHEAVADTETIDSGKKNVYCYRQLSAAGLPEFSSIQSIWVDVYYKNDVETAAVPYGSVQIYDDRSSNDAYKLDKNDKKALKGEIQ